MAPGTGSDPFAACIRAAHRRSQLSVVAICAALGCLAFGARERLRVERIEPQVALARGPTPAAPRIAWDGDKLNAWLSENIREELEARRAPHAKLSGFSVDCGVQMVFVGQRALTCRASTYGAGASAARLEVVLDPEGAVIAWSVEGV